MPKKANKTKQTNQTNQTNDYVPCEIIESEEVSESVIPVETQIPTKKPAVLSTYYLEDPKIIEIGVDEVGRGPLFGRVYTAAVILPKDGTFDHSKMKDSKKFSSKKKISEAAQYIKDNAIAWNITYEDEKFIDEHNILLATQKSMHKSIEGIISKYELNDSEKIQLLIDGNYFKPYTYFNKTKKMIEQVDHVCIEGGDNKYTAIAAASILAKVERDSYIEELCNDHPELSEKYNINSNKGYGAKKHLDGIKEHGITIWHRRSFGICKNYI
uniref:Ribonuclease HII n=1 Tax=viral metagenome TaxID=1070528 RepID=A0A6C0KUC3_9ZZZZ